jgi:hypothetical protein
LAYYAAALGLMLFLQPEDWSAAGRAGRLARLLWTLAWLTYLVHLGVAFHYYHDWSHERAVAHVREVAGVGEGIWMSHLFTAVWSADVLSWWVRPRRRVFRPRWVDALLHAFMLFITFNATVVYESGWIRYAGLAFFACLGVLGAVAWSRRRCVATPP